jgi:glycosyltransferase involved in cell wall biosynthesis
MRIVLVTDAWRPQVNGVVRTYENAVEQLRLIGHEVELITPEGFATVPCPSYPSIRLAMFPWPQVHRRLGQSRPDAVHIATEGPLGTAARGWCRRHSVPFTTSFHTQFPEYIRMRAPIPADWSYAWLRRFHGAAVRTLVPTPSQRDRLLERRFCNIEVWSRGVDTRLFHPRDKSFLGLARPVFAYMGRVAVEKNVEAFLDLDLPGSKLVVGDGPALDRLRARYPAVLFTGFKFGEELAKHLAAADVFVFPSLTDTFGIVLLEAMACGVPVAAFPVTGPVDVVQDGVTGVLDQDLRRAALRALELDPARCVRYASQCSWRSCAERLLSLLAPVTAVPELAAR